MGREYTVFQFDVDESAVRRLLARIPGVTSLPPDERGAPEARTPASSDGTGQATADAATGGSTDADPVETDESGGDAAGAEAHLADAVAPGEHRAGARKWTGPSTPWPGAPTDEEEPEGRLDRLRSKRTVLVAGAMLGLGVVGAVAAWFLKFRGDGDSGAGGGEYRAPDRPGDATATDRGRDASAREPPAADSESRSYPVDAAPVVGIAFLAGSSLLLRYVKSRAEP